MFSRVFRLKEIVLIFLFLLLISKVFFIEINFLSSIMLDHEKSFKSMHLCEIVSFKMKIHSNKPCLLQ